MWLTMVRDGGVEREDDRVPGLAPTQYQTLTTHLCALNFALKLNSGGSPE